MEGSPDTRHRHGRFGLLVLLVAVLTAWTAAILLVPSMRFAFDWPRAQLPLETAGVVIAALTAAIGFLKRSLGGSQRWLLVSLAFVVMALNRLVFALVIPTSDLAPQSSSYVWLVGRLEMATLLVLGAWMPKPFGGLSRISYRVAAGVSLAALVLIQVVVWAVRQNLPPLIVGAPERTSVAGLAPGLTAVDLVLGIVGAGLFFAAAIGYRRSDIGGPATKTWLAAALILGGFSQLHVMLNPTVFTEQVTTGDLLRIALSAVLLAGLLHDVQATYTRERNHRRELEAEYDLQRERLRRLEELDRAKVDLYRMLNHELMHPVGAIRSLAVALRRAVARDDAGTSEVALHGLLRQTELLRDLAERAPDLTELRPESPAARRRSDVQEMLRRVARTFSHLEGRLTISIDPAADELGSVEVDEPRIMEVFQNLLSNAAKFSPAGSPIELSARRDVDGVVFAVRDAGIGIPEGVNGRLFERFTRLPDAEARGVEGSGLGLHIARMIVESHDGRIWANPNADRGATFSFSLPTVDGR